MRRTARDRILSGLFIAGGLLAWSVPCRAQQATAASSAKEPDDLKAEVRELAETVRDLQSQVRSLNQQIQNLQSRQENASDVPGRAATEQTPSGGSGNASTAYSAYSPIQPGQSSQTGAMESVAPGDTLATRVGKLEENQQLMDAKLSDQYQTKVESGSHYRLRLSGMVLLNLFDNRGTVDNLDFPEIAVPQGQFESAQSFGGSLRQTQIRIETFGPDFLGAHTSANVDFDFAGSTSNAPNGAILSLPRFRTGIIRLDWENTSLVAGQDFLFFAPLEPTSLASVAVPPLSYAGNLWGWTPQVRIEHKVIFSGHSNLTLQGGVLDSLTGDIPEEREVDRYPSWGEQSGQPAFAGRVSWSDRILGRTFTVGEGAFYGKQYWALGRDVNGWAATTDLTLPLGNVFEFSGEFYRGAAVGGFGGAIGQDILLSGNFVQPSTSAIGIDSMGGWAQLKFQPVAKFQINGAFGLDNPFASEIRRFSSTPPIYGALLTKNQSEFVNFIYQPRSDIMISVEYRRLKTFDLQNAVSANHINFAWGYLF